jgi:hypothetical protein
MKILGLAEHMAQPHGGSVQPSEIGLSLAGVRTGLYAIFWADTAGEEGEGDRVLPTLEKRPKVQRFYVVGGSPIVIAKFCTVDDCCLLNKHLSEVSENEGYMRHSERLPRAIPIAPRPFDAAVGLVQAPASHPGAYGGGTPPPVGGWSSGPRG